MRGSARRRGGLPVLFFSAFASIGVTSRDAASQDLATTAGASDPFPAQPSGEPHACVQPDATSSGPPPSELGPRPLSVTARRIRVETDEVYMTCTPRGSGLLCDVLLAVSLRNTSPTPYGLWLVLPSEARQLEVNGSPWLVSRYEDCTQRAYVPFEARGERRLTLSYAFTVEPSVHPALDLVRTALEVRHPIAGTRVSAVATANLSFATTRSEVWGVVRARRVRISLPPGFSPVTLGPRALGAPDKETVLTCATGRLRGLEGSAESSGPDDGGTRRRANTLCSGKVRLLVRVERGAWAFPGGPVAGISWTGRSGAGRVHAGYEFSLLDPSALLALSTESELHDDLSIVASAGVATSKRTLLPSYGVRFGLPVRIRPDAAVGARLEGTLSYPLGPFGVAASAGLEMLGGDWGAVIGLEFGM